MSDARRAASPPPEPRGRWLDIDVHGVLGLRFVDGADADEAAVRRELGQLESPLAGPPDLVVRFVPRLPLRDLCFVENGRSGFTDDGFVLLAHGRHRAAVRLPLDALGEPCEILCERGTRVLPVLHPIVRLLALGKGYAPLHASAFVSGGVGVVAAGWAHGGKTSALLAFAAHGAAYVGDDLVLLRADGRRMLGIPAPLALRDWQVEGLPAARRQVGGARLALGRAARRVGRLAALFDGAAPSRARALLARGSAALERRLKVDVPLEVAFGDRTPLAAEPRVVFLMMSHAAADIRVEPAEPHLLAERLASSIQQELLGLTEQYLAFRYAFPERRSALIEGAHEAAVATLRRALADKEAYVLRHPYPVPLAALYTAMRPHVEERLPCPA